ncbi:hypothetical protein [Neorhizobium sp. NCHU2750]|uniref:hypothetical protein n=1 Tax=Neorhizobium sp. NCHU2750 TaxID=1825976 RepID=UPI000EB62D9E|nr:hypothetical protein NCHU2750_28430 [Neorhizobium sp. NCHU2750]
MSDHRDSTTAPKSIGELSANVVSQLELIRGFRNLEHQICCLTHMSNILGDLLDHAMVDRTGDRKPDDAFHILLSADEVDQLAFAWNDVSYRARLLENAFFAIGKDM